MNRLHAVCSHAATLVNFDNILIVRKECILVCMQSRAYLLFPQWNLNFSRQILEKYSHTKFHKNPCSGSRVLPCGDRQTDRSKLIVAFRNLAKAPKNYSNGIKYTQVVNSQNILCYSRKLLILLVMQTQCIPARYEFNFVSFFR